MSDYSRSHFLLRDPLFISDCIKSEAILVAPLHAPGIADHWDRLSKTLQLPLAADDDFHRMSAGERVAACILFALAVAKAKQKPELEFLFEGTQQRVTPHRLARIAEIAAAEGIQCGFWRLASGGDLERAL